MAVEGDVRVRVGQGRSGEVKGSSEKLLEGLGIFFILNVSKKKKKNKVWTK